MVADCISMKASWRTILAEHLQGGIMSTNVMSEDVSGMMDFDPSGRVRLSFRFFRPPIKSAVLDEHVDGCRAPHTRVAIGWSVWAVRQNGKLPVAFFVSKFSAMRFARFHVSPRLEILETHGGYGWL